MKYFVVLFAIVFASQSFANTQTNLQNANGIPDFTCDNGEESWSDGYFGVSYAGGKITFELYEGQMVAEANDLTINGQEIAILNRQLKKVVEGEEQLMEVNASLTFNAGPQTLAVTLIVDGQAWRAEEVLRCR